MNIQLVLKALGVKVDTEFLEKVIADIPDLIKVLESVPQRLEAIEKSLASLHEKFEALEVSE